MKVLSCVSAKGKEKMADVELVDCSIHVPKEEIVIHDYCKNIPVIDPATTSPCFVIQAGATPADIKALDKFCRYLLERKKAGIVSIEDVEYLLLTYSKNSGASFVLRGFPYHRQLNATKEILASPIVLTSSQPPPSSSSSAAKVQTVAEKMKEIEDNLRRDLQQFDVDPSFHCLRLKPMSEMDRYVVHDVVSAEYPHLASSSVGDDSERHAVVYRLGHAPEDVQQSQSTGPLIKVIPKNYRKSSGNSMHAIESSQLPSTMKLVAVDKNKRDRRSEEEILQDILKKKKT